MFIYQVSPRCRNVLHLAGIKQKVTSPGQHQQLISPLHTQEVPPKNDEENSLSKKHTTQKKEEQNEDKDAESKHDLMEVLTMESRFVTDLLSLSAFCNTRTC